MKTIDVKPLRPYAFLRNENGTTSLLVIKSTTDYGVTFGRETYRYLHECTGEFEVFENEAGNEIIVAKHDTSQGVTYSVYKHEVKTGKFYALYRNVVSVTKVDSYCWRVYTGVYKYNFNPEE